MTFDQQPVVRVDRAPDSTLDPDGWPCTIPAVAQVLRDGLDLPPGVTFLIGENGSGKSTLVEAVALAYGLSPEGGSTHGRHETFRTESGVHNVPESQTIESVTKCPATIDDFYYEGGYYTK